jgi:hypothetical protein
MNGLVDSSILSPCSGLLLAGSSWDRFLVGRLMTDIREHPYFEQNP